MSLPASRVPWATMCPPNHITAMMVPLIMSIMMGIFITTAPKAFWLVSFRSWLRLENFSCS